MRLVGRKQYTLLAGKRIRLRTYARSMNLQEVSLAIAKAPEAIPTSPQVRYSIATGLVDVWTGQRWNAPPAARLVGPGAVALPSRQNGGPGCRLAG